MTPARQQPCGAVIARVEPGSIAEEIALQPGDVLLAVDGAPVTDYIAYRFAIADELVTLTVARDEDCWEIEIEKDADDDLGLGFASDVFDGMRRCNNRCVFCFEAQMPAAMRPSLRLRDDDFRLSFLHGNFVTLTNLRRGDVTRIIREHLSPLFISVHATETALRRRLLGNPRAADLLPLLRRLGDGGIDLHAQIVLCPDWNDGAVLARTLDDLAALHPALISVGIVPVGLTAHRPSGPDVRAVTPADAGAVLDAVARRQADFLATLGTRFVYAADEFYLLAGRALPPADAYEDFPQRENGIGLARQFLDELARTTFPTPTDQRRLTLVTGMLAAPLLTQLADRLCAAGWHAEVVAVPNTFYGGGVSVAGLLTGRDMLTALRGRAPDDLLVLPATTRNADGLFLDDMTPDALARALGMPIAFADGPRALAAVLASP